MQRTRSISRFCSAVIFSGTLATTALAGPDWVEDDVEQDAGSLPGDAQVTQGNGPLTVINGKLTGLSPGANGKGSLDFEDLFLIRITDPENFSATTSADFGGSADFDTRLWLFSAEGFGLLANDDAEFFSAAAGKQVGGSFIGNMSTDGTGVVITEPGLYIIGVTRFDNNAESDSGLIYNFAEPNEISGPDGPGGEDICTGWQTTPGAAGSSGFGDEYDIVFPEGAVTFAEALGACCTSDTALCFDEFTEEECLDIGGTYLGDGSVCKNNDCEDPDFFGACCLSELPVGGPQTLCEQLPEEACLLEGGVWQGPLTSCVEPGICIPTEVCGEPEAGDCCEEDGNGTPGCNDEECCVLICTADPFCCEVEWDGICAEAALEECAVCNGDDGPDRVSATEKGSLLIWPKVELRWDEDGELVQDTFLSLTNDMNQSVRVRLYFINGDDPLPANGGEPAHPGWNRVGVAFNLTPDQPIYWSAATGLPAGGGFPPFTILDPGPPPGRPDPEGSDDRVLRGYIIGWAVNNDNEEIRFNHLAGTGTLVDYRDGKAWEYNTYNFPTANPNIAHGEPTGTAGTLFLDGTEYVEPYSHLLMNFQAAGSSAFSSGGIMVTSDTDLTLLPVSVDLRQETEGPVRTKAEFLVWNENEVKFSNTHRCIACWDQFLISGIAAPNHFLLSSLQTDHGKARIEGLASMLCPPNSTDAALLGVAARLLEMNGTPNVAAGTNLHGMGEEDAIIKYDIPGGGGGGSDSQGTEWFLLPSMGAAPNN